MKKTKLFLPVILVAGILMLQSCAAVIKGNTSKVNLESEPPGAQVFVDGEFMGTTPTRLKLKSKHNYIIEFKKEGYETKTAYLAKQIAVEYVVLDVILGLLPVVVDAVTYSWYEFDQKYINAYLEKKN